MGTGQLNLSLYLNVNFLLRLLCFAVVAVGSGALAAPVFGRYQGVLHHDQLKRDQLVKLDFISARTTTNELELKAIVSLHLGDFQSGEYVSFHYERVRFNLLTQTLVFDDPEQALSIFVTEFGNGKLVGNVVSSWHGPVGKMELSTQKTVKPTQPLIEPLWGEYLGQCGDVSARLRLYTMRSTADMAHLAQPFAAYSIQGNLLLDCQDGQCLNYRFLAGTYNYFQVKHPLSLDGTAVSIRCDTDGTNVSCHSPDPKIPGMLSLDKCTMKRASKETAGPRKMSPVENKGELPSVSPENELPTSELAILRSGEYRGYVFHEYLNQYQAASLNMTVFQGGAGPDGGTRISAFSRLYFGDHSSIEFIPYKFDEETYPNPTSGSQHVILSRIDDKIDAVVQITEVKGDVIRGIWYSLIFGRVGPFEFHRDKAPALASTAKLIQPLSGLYRGTRTYYLPQPLSQWRIRLQVGVGSRFAQSENPFFPNVIRGALHLFPLIELLPILDGSYDFFTGRFGFFEVTMDESHTWIGTQVDREHLHLHHINSNPQPVFFKFQPEVFTLQRDQ